MNRFSDLLNDITILCVKTMTGEARYISYQLLSADFGSCLCAVLLSFLYSLTLCGKRMIYRCTEQADEQMNLLVTRESDPQSRSHAAVQSMR